MTMPELLKKAVAGPPEPLQQDAFDFARFLILRHEDQTPPPARQANQPQS